MGYVRKVMKVELGAGFIGEVKTVETAPDMMQGHRVESEIIQGCIEELEKHVGINLPMRGLIGN